MEKKVEYFNSLSVSLERMGDLDGARRAILISSVMSPYGTSHIKQLIRICVRTGDVELGLISIMNLWNLERDLERCKIELEILHRNRKKELDEIIVLSDISDITSAKLDIIYAKLSNFEENYMIRDKIKQSITGRNDDYEEAAKRFLKILYSGEENRGTVVHSSERFSIDGKTKLGVGGLADRVKGAATCMIVAASIGARFQFDWRTPFHINDFFDVPKELVFTAKEENYSKHNWIDSGLSSEIRDSLSAEDVASIFSDETNVINCNILSLEVLKNPTNDRLKEFSNLGRIFWVGTIFRILEYKPGMCEMSALISLIELKDYYDSCLGVQFRLGGERKGWDDPLLDDLENLERVLEAAVSGKKGRTLVLFASDSEEARKKSLDLELEDCEILSLQIPITHVDRSPTEIAEIGFSSVLLENYCLSICDEVAIRKGAFGQMAANRCFTESKDIRI